MSLPIIPFLRSHWCIDLPVPTKSFEGQTVIITGSNSGLGLEAARHIVQLKASQVILAVRDISRGKAAEASIRESTGIASGIIEVWELDLASYASVKAFAARAATLERLDVVVENAGILTQDFAMAEDNERTITVNVVSTMLLALLLLPKLRETSVTFEKDVVLTFTGSFVHWLTRFPERKAKSILEECAKKDKARMMDRYFVSKLMELLAFRELANQLTASEKPGNIIASILNPGVVRTALERTVHGIYLTIRSFVSQRLLARSTEEGSRTLVHAAYGGREAHGKYLDDCKVAPPNALSKFVRSDEGLKTQQRLWKELTEKLEFIEPNILQNI